MRAFLTAAAVAGAIGVVTAQSTPSKPAQSKAQSKPAQTAAAQAAHAPATSQGPGLDYATIGKIRTEGLTRSQVMDHVSWLADVYGPRLTGSPNILRASDWAIKKFTEWGLANPHREHWAFGRGWSLVRFQAHLIEPAVQPIVGFPTTWSPGTPGVVTADVIRVDIQREADFEKYRGKLRGKILLSQPARAVPMLEGPIVLRMGEKEFAEAATTPVPQQIGRATSELQSRS